MNMLYTVDQIEEMALRNVGHLSREYKRKHGHILDRDAMYGSREAARAIAMCVKIPYRMALRGTLTKLMTEFPMDVVNSYAIAGCDKQAPHIISRTFLSRARAFGLETYVNNVAFDAPGSLNVPHCIGFMRDEMHDPLYVFRPLNAPAPCLMTTAHLPQWPASQFYTEI